MDVLSCRGPYRTPSNDAVVLRQNSSYYWGMALIPSTFVPVVRAALVTQGFPAGTITDAGEVSFAGLASGAYNKVEFSSNLTPAIAVDTETLDRPGPVPWFVRVLKPTVTLRGPAGRVVIAPAGEASKLGLFVAVGIVGGIFAAGFFLGKAMK